MNKIALSSAAIIVILVSMVLVKMLIGLIVIRGHSMEPSMKDGSNHIVLNKYFKITRGNIVLYNYDMFPDYYYAGRVIGLPGDNLKLEKGKVFINGRELQESYLTPNTKTLTYSKMTHSTDESTGIEKFVELPEEKYFEEGVDYLVPIDNYFILGDNRESSVDSRQLGFVNYTGVTSKIIF